MEEKTIFRLHDENDVKQPESLEEKTIPEVVEEIVDNTPKKDEPIKKSKKGKTKKKGLFSQMSGSAKVFFVLGLLLVIGSIGALAYTQLPSLLPNSNTPSSNNTPSNKPSGTPTTPTENVVTEQDATVLQLTEDAGEEYMKDLLFIGDSNYNRMYMLGLLDLDHVIGVDGMGVQSVPGSRAVYFVEKSDPITIPSAVKDMQPKTIIMNFGTNNLVAGTAESFIENYEEAIDAIQEAYPYADIIIQSIPPIGKDLPSGYRMVDYKKVYTFNNALIKMCEDRGLHYLNVTEDVWRAQDGHCKSEYITSDGIHMEQKAYEKLLEYVRTHALLTEDTRPEITKKMTRKAAPVVVYQYQCDVVVTSAMESFYEAGFIDYKKVKEGEQEENYKEPDTYRFTISKSDATKGSEEEMGKALFSSVASQVSNRDKAQVAISYKAADDGGYVFTVLVKEVCKHNFEVKDEVEATCTQPGSKTLVCKICGKKQVLTTDKLDHKFDMSTAHDYDESSQTMKVKCTLCGKEYDVKHGDSDHEWNEGTISKEPSCTEAGIKKVKCNICGVEKDIPIEALGHDFSVFVSDSTSPSCENGGKATYKCSRCEATSEKDTPALGHDFSVFVETITPAGCTTGGKDKYKCSRCEATTEKDTSATGHIWGEWITDVPPQEGVQGHRYRDCTQCDAHEEETLPALEPTTDPNTDSP